VIRKIINNTYCVFACGGGAILRRENISLIKKNSTVVYLMVSTREAIDRLSGSTGRPLIPEKNNRQKERAVLKIC